MKLGFLTAPFPETPLMEVADWAATSGFEVLEIACWPRSSGPTRRYAGTSHIDVANLTDGQAKDMMIDPDGLHERGVFSNGIGWHVPRIPGLGDVDWGVVFSGLYRAGFDGDCIIEHEDRRFEGTDEKVRQGFLIARDILRPYCK